MASAARSARRRQEREQRKANKRAALAQQSTVGLKPIGGFSSFIESVTQATENSLKKINNTILSVFGKGEVKIVEEIESTIKVRDLLDPGDIELKGIDEAFGVVEEEKQSEKENTTLKVNKVKKIVKRKFSKPSVYRLIESLGNYICTVDFIRITNPQVERIMKCSTDGNYVPNMVDGKLGSYGGRIIVWDFEKRGYRSFYANRVIQISYEEEIYEDEE